MRASGTGSVRMVFVLIFGTLASTALAAHPPFYIVRHGKATSTIVIPDAADSWTREGAKWVMVYAAKSTGAYLRIVPESKVPNGRLISVGHTQLAKRAGIGVENLKWDGYRMLVKGRVLYLIGRDEDLLNGTGAKGTNRAAAAFAEQFCGVRFFLPTREGEIAPNMRDVAVPRKLDKTFVPVFAYIDGRWPYRTGRAASFAHGTGTGAAVKSMRRWGYRSFPLLVPADNYFDEHPEYFALIRGKRQRGPHLCTSHPEVRQLLLEGVRKQFEKGCDWYLLGHEPAHEPCRCPRCERAAGSANPGERLMLLYRWITDECRKSHPNKTVQLAVRDATLRPPIEFEKFGDNVVLDLCDAGDTEVVAAWRGKARAITATLYMGDAEGPMGMDVHVTPKEIAQVVRFLRENGFIGIRQYLGEANWGLQGPVFYAFGKLAEDPDRDAQPLVEEYCLGVFGDKAGKAMLEFFNALYARHEQLLPHLSVDGSRAPDLSRKAGFGAKYKGTPRKLRSITEVYAALYPPSFTQKLDALLRRAENEAETDRAKGWLRPTRDCLDFSRFLGGMLVSYREHKGNPTAENLAKVKTWVDRFEEFRERVVSYDDAYVQRWFPGHDLFCLWLTSEGRHASIRYASWKERKKQVLQEGLRGMAIGLRISGLDRSIAEPITLIKP